MLFSTLTLILHVIASLAISLRILYRKLAVSTTLAWIIMISALPGIGLVFYFLFGDHRLGRRRLKLGRRIREHYQKHYEVTEDDATRDDLDVSPYFANLSGVISKETGFHPSAGNKIAVYDAAEDITQSMIQDIESAAKTCFLEFYIIDHKGIVDGVLKAIVAASSRGVDCRILADAFGSKKFFKSNWPGKLRDAGVIVEESLSVGIVKSLSKRSDLRNHRKLLLVDQRVGYIGSYNLIDPKFFKAENGCGEWVDIMARVEGHILASLATVFNTDFIFDNAGLDFGKEDLKSLPRETISIDHSRDSVMQLVPSGPEMNSSIIYETIVAAIFGARDKIVICTPYFVPDEAISLALSNAAKRGLDVTVIVPKNVDSIMARYASQSNFTNLLKSGVKIAQYDDGLLHTKAVLIDDDICGIGTVNMDMRSFYLNLELTLIVYDTVFSKRMHDIIDGYLKSSSMLDLDTWETRGKVIQLKENIMRLASPVL